MRIDFDQELKTPKGEPFRGPVGPRELLVAFGTLSEEQPDLPLRDAQRVLAQRWSALQGEPQTLADVAHDALLSSEKAQKGSATEKRTRARLAQRICNGGIVDLGDTDLTLLKDELEKHCNAAALIACDDALVEYVEPSQEPEAEAAE
jgi:hypothetical protein